jgi:hypothetical protein
MARNHADGLLNHEPTDMNWPASFLISFLSGVLGLFAGAAVGLLFVKWHRVSGFEGGSGYFMISIALLGGLASLVIGLLIARLGAADASRGFFRTLATAWGSVLGIALFAIVLCRLGADAAPPPPIEQAAVVPDRFDSIQPDAPLEEWLPFLFDGSSSERVNAVLKIVAGRQAELAKLIRSPDGTVRKHALDTTRNLPGSTPEVVEAVLDEGRAIAEGIRRFNAMQ